MAEIKCNVNVTDLDIFKHAMRILQQCYQLTSDNVTKQYILDELNNTMGDTISIEKYLDAK